MTSPPPISSRLYNLARVFMFLSSLLQVGVVSGLYIAWKHYNVPFWTAAKNSIVIGLSIHSALTTAASLLYTIARVQPVTIFLAYISRFILVTVFFVLHYLERLSLIQSSATLGALYAVASIFTWRLKRNARRAILPAHI